VRLLRLIALAFSLSVALFSHLYLRAFFEHHDNGGMPTPMITSILLIALGLAAIVFGFLANEFYGAFIRRPRPNEKPMPKWLGRIIFFAGGMWFIYSGISHLLRH
jgi:hypothetical protein